MPTATPNTFRFGGAATGRVTDPIEATARKLRLTTSWPSQEKIVKLLYLSGAPLFLTACQTLPVVEPASSPTSSTDRTFAQASCGGCHAVGANEISPRSNAPPFPVIVNQEGVTRETLSVWLGGAHNYPREMDFYLDGPKVDALVTYMLTLRDPKYARSPD